MPISGYYRFPTIHDDTIIFVSEDDLWSVPAGGGIARRLTANLGAISHPFFSPDGKLVAFTGREEGHNEVYVMPSDGGPVRRITYLGVRSNVVGWSPDGKQILFVSDSSQPIDGIAVVFGVSPEGGLPEQWPIGPAVSISIASGNRTVIGRNNNDPARWKRYKGGTAGDIWVDAEGQGNFRRMLRLKGNLARPLWIGDRIYFLADHEGFGNLYSCLPSGEDVQRHTHRNDYYVRFPSTDGKRIVYHAGADLYVFDPQTNRSRKVNVEYHSPRVHRQRRFVDAARYLESYAPHPEGHSLAITSRGKSFVMGNWEGAVIPQLPERGAPTRFYFTRWLPDGERVVTLADRGQEDALEIHSPYTEDPEIRIGGMDLGRPHALRVAPTADEVAIGNHRNELIFVDLAGKTSQVVDRSEYGRVQGLDWSPDGRWVAYALPLTNYTTALKIWDRSNGEIHTVSEPVLHDYAPVFDPGGKYLYFLASRDLNPVYDNLHFDLGFPKGVRPFLITLQADLISPFAPVARPLTPAPKKDEEGKPAEEPTAGGEEGEKKPDAPKPVKIDFEGITRRVLPFPVPEGIYGQIAAIEGKALFTSYQVEGALGSDWRPGEAQARATLEMFDFDSQKAETLVPGITDFQLSQDGKTLYLRVANRLRALKAGEKPDEKTNGEPPGRKSGWMDLGRVKVAVDPPTEWPQMAHEAWRLQREHFWTSNMSSIDWNAVWRRYEPLLERIGTRGEFSDLMWEMQGELGTSHAYEMGGDYRSEPSYPQGFLGADYAWDEKSGAYTITRIVEGTAGETDKDSPLNAPGVNVRVGDRLKAINGQKLGKDVLPHEALTHQASAEVILSVERDGETRDVTVKTLRSEVAARYREWVEANRRLVHEATGGKVGYIHIPDMGAHGYAEFHRLYLSEVHYDAMIVDVRFNRGGHVSQLLIEKLARKPVGYDISRWGQPEPYPGFSVAGPMVAITNQWAGSDGDIFSHVFKLMKLGPLIGTRTWGGVIGISPRNSLADGSMTTQPEYSFWFKDVGWGVENYGTDPDIEIDVAPQDYARNYDPQMERAIQLILEELERNPVVKPTFADRPILTPPDLIGAENREEEAWEE